jgi:hypothetical protein
MQAEGLRHVADFEPQQVLARARRIVATIETGDPTLGLRG